jgi:hypothetical protein
MKTIAPIAGLAAKSLIAVLTLDSMSRGEWSMQAGEF